MIIFWPGSADVGGLRGYVAIVRVLNFRLNSHSQVLCLSQGTTVLLRLGAGSELKWPITNEVIESYRPPLPNTHPC